MVIFHSYVSLPEGKETTTIWPYGTSATILRKIFWENCVSAIAAKTPQRIYWHLKIFQYGKGDRPWD
jgi:hypothetical protein